jgi:arylsulfatase A-like enzyme/Flp pilus assembly protein TadD
VEVRTRLPLWLPAALGLAAAGCARAPSPARHLVLVTIDTLRADRVGIYGGAVATPRLDGIARQGAWAPEAMAHVPLTRPSHVSLLTGRLPAETGVRDNISPALVPETPLLAEVLKGAGFETAAFVSSVVLEPSSGLSRGYDTYSASFEGTGEAQFLSSLQRKGALTTADAIAWLEARRRDSPQARLHLWLHLYEPHDPYEPPEPYAARYAGRLYDGEVAYADELLGRLDDALTRLGLREDTLLVVTSDHGEGLGEHEEALHGFFAYQTTLRVPLIVRGPGVRPGTRLASTVRLVDVFPSALELLGVPAPAELALAGASVAPALRGERRAEPVTYAESLVPLLHFGWSDLRVVREGRWKYIQAPRPELYDLEADPGERVNLAASQAARVEAMRRVLGGFLEAERRAGPANAGAAPPELLEKLGALGYVGGAAPAETATPGADPKDRVADFRFANDAIRNGLLLLHANEFAASVARFRAVLERGISSFEIHYYLARGLVGLRRAQEAVPHFEEATRRQPAHVAAWEGLAESRALARDLEGALAALRQGQGALPGEARLRLAEGRLLWELGRRPEARAAFEAALPLAPTNGRARCRLGELLREMGEIEAAIARQREAVEVDPGSATCWNSLGMTLGGNARLAEAEQAFREAWRLDDTDHRYAFNLGLILQRQGRGDEARPWFEKALQINPEFAPARDELRALTRSAK